MNQAWFGGWRVLVVLLVGFSFTNVAVTQQDPTESTETDLRLAVPQGSCQVTETPEGWVSSLTCDTNYDGWTDTHDAWLYDGDGNWSVWTVDGDLDGRADRFEVRVPTGDGGWRVVALDEWGAVLHEDEIPFLRDSTRLELHMVESWEALPDWIAVEDCLCSLDEDCVIVPNANCCPCSGGGFGAVVSGGFSEELEEMIAETCGDDVACPAVMSSSPTCLGGPRPVCYRGRCAVITDRFDRPPAPLVETVEP